MTDSPIARKELADRWAAAAHAQTEALGKALQDRPGAVDEWNVCRAIAPSNPLATWFELFERDRPGGDC